jgi:hypothetical protein
MAWQVCGQVYAMKELLQNPRLLVQVAAASVNKAATTSLRSGALHTGAVGGSVGIADGGGGEVEVEQDLAVLLHTQPASGGARRHCFRLSNALHALALVEGGAGVGVGNGAGGVGADADAGASMMDGDVVGAAMQTSGLPLHAQVASLLQVRFSR